MLSGSSAVTEGDSNGSVSPSASPSELDATPTPSPTDASPSPSAAASDAPSTAPAAGNAAAAQQQYSSTSTAAAQAQAAAYPSYGLSQGFQPIELSNADLDTMFTGIASTGAKIIRLDLPWQQIQPSGPTSFSFSNTLRVYDSARAHGLTVLPVSSGMPSWAGAISPTNESSYYNFLYQAALVLVPRGITTIEIWNEANLTGMTPTQYTQKALIPGASGFRAAAATLGKTATIVSTGLAPASTNGHDFSQLDFLKGIYAAGGSPYFDAVGDHPYTWPEDPAITTGYNWMQKAADLRALMVSKGDASKQIWATEFGFPTNDGARGVTEAQQATFINHGASIWDSYSWGGPLIFYSYRDLTAKDTDPEHNFGVLRSDGSAKASLAVITQVMAKG